VLPDSAGVMYWGDAYFHRIETANIDGTGRKILWTKIAAVFSGFALHAGNVYYTNWSPPYDEHVVDVFLWCLIRLAISILVS